MTTSTGTSNVPTSTVTPSRHLRIAIVGFGSMGHALSNVISSSHHHIHAIVDPSTPQATHTELSATALSGADVAIDFTSATSVLANLPHYLSNGTPVILGTTGWYDKLPEVRKLVESQNGKVLWSSNFSIGVNLFFRLIEEAAQLFANVEEYDVWGYELHHYNKADSPSGTAKTAVELLLKNMPRKRRAVFDKLDRKILPEEIHFASVRGGAVNFEHTIGFDSAADAVIIQHKARDRSGYASGAVTAAEWLIQQQSGFFSFADFMSALTVKSR